MKTDKVLTQERLRELISYTPETGEFVWISGRRRHRPAGCRASSGYVVIVIDGRQYRAHQLAILFMLGRMPAMPVDHFNGDKSDNRWLNLREVTISVNTQNQRRGHHDSKTGFLGVSPDRSRFRAQIYVAGRFVHLGIHATAELAHAAYVEAKRKLHAGCTI